jgi:hypothetical protein
MFASHRAEGVPAGPGVGDVMQPLLVPSMPLRTATYLTPSRSTRPDALASLAGYALK